MNKLYKIIMGFLYTLAGIIVLLCATVFLFAAFDLDEQIKIEKSTNNDIATGNEEYSSTSKYVAVDNDISEYTTKNSNNITEITTQNSNVVEEDNYINEYEDEPLGKMLLGNNLYVGDDCFTFMGFVHGLDFRMTVNKVLSNAGINEDITNYKGVVYFTTSYNSSYGNKCIYDNIEIASRMGNYYLNEFPVKLNLKFDRAVGGETYDGSIPEEQRMSAILKEVRVRFINTEDNIRYYADNEKLVQEIVTVIGEPTSVITYEALGVHKYIWEREKDSLQVLYRLYNIEDDSEHEGYWCLDYVAVVHNE